MRKTNASQTIASLESEIVALTASVAQLDMAVTAATAQRKKDSHDHRYICGIFASV